jgi:hypothetical protein
MNGGVGRENLASAADMQRMDLAWLKIFVWTSSPPDDLEHGATSGQ